MSRALLIPFLLLAATAFAQPERPIRRPVDNKLALETIEAGPVRADAPDAIPGTTARLSFHTSPLSGKGLLSEQIRDALKALDKANGDATFLKLRAFIAGTGDVRRVHSIVTEEFAGKRWPLPAITSILVGALPGENTQVVIESISEDRKNSVNPGGLMFFSAQPSIASLENATKSSGAKLLRITCFADSLTGAEAARAAALKAFPGVAGAFLQATRNGLGERVACEGVGRLPLRAGAPPVERQSVGVLVRLPKLVFTAAQAAFGETGVKQAQDRLTRAATGEILFENQYSVAGSGQTTGVFIEGLSTQDATVAVEAVTAP